ncbi:MAG: RES family NAD+ phosphorylase [Arcicella sp.]|nr:RES family NAD+ phosphorylase [Arcicella sp.]
MQVFRITTAKSAGNLRGSGFAARWNSNGVFVAYTASSRALACLEMVVHLNSDRLKSEFGMSVVEIPEEVNITKISIEDLPKGWTEHDGYQMCQEVGDDWIQAFETCVLQVPSAVIKHEFNYLVNPQHSDFSKLKIIEIEDFEFDLRIKSS